MNLKSSPSYTKPIVLMACGALLYFFFLQSLPALEIYRKRTVDFLMLIEHRIRPLPKSADEMLLIYVDDASIQRLGQKWPLERKVFAKLLNRIAKANAACVAFDFVFAGEGDPADDYLLKMAIEEAGKVVLASFIDQSGQYFLPLAEFRKSARGFGFVNKILDSDSRVRSSRLIYRDTNGESIGQPWEAAVLEVYHPDYLKYIAGRTQMSIHYRFDFGDIERISIAEALTRDDWQAKAKGKIVLIGAASSILHDHYQTPFGYSPGIIVNMNLLSNLIEGSHLRSVSSFTKMLIFVFALFMAYYASGRSNLIRALSTMLIGSTILILIHMGLLWGHYAGDLFTTFVGAWIAFFAMFFLRFFELMTENMGLRTKVATDPLTGLNNRRALEVWLEEELVKFTDPIEERRMDAYTDLSLMMLDVDNFKMINDRFGHPFGDDVLKKVSFSIKECIRKEDFAARYGGEEFCVLLPRTRKSDGARIAEKIREYIASSRLNYGDQAVSPTVSIGLAAAREDALLTAKGLIRAADEALYQAKKTGKNRVVLYQKN